MSFFTGFGVSAVSYWLLSYLFPPRGSQRIGSQFEERDVSNNVEGDEEDKESEKEYGKRGEAGDFVYSF